jgi:hypothetical protein
MDKRRLPNSLLAIAAMQILAILVLPPTVFASIDPLIWVAGVAVFALLGFNLIRLKDWARTATVFVQGLNIIVRLLTLVSNVVPRGTDPEINAMLLMTALLSMFLSGVVLYLIEQPDIQLIMQQ